MTRPPSEAVDLTHLIPHLQAISFTSSKLLVLWPLESSQRMELARSELIALEEGARDTRGQI